MRIRQVIASLTNIHATIILLSTIESFIPSPGGKLPTHSRRTNNNNSRPTILIRSYHTSAPLFRCFPIPHCTGRAHSTSNPSVNWWCMTSYDRPSSRDSSSRISPQPAFSHGRSRRGSVLVPLTVFFEPHSGYGSFARYPEQLGEGAS